MVKATALSLLQNYQDPSVIRTLQKSLNDLQLTVFELLPITLICFAITDDTEHELFELLYLPHRILAV